MAGEQVVEVGAGGAGVELERRPGHVAGADAKVQPVVVGGPAVPELHAGLGGPAQDLGRVGGERLAAAALLHAVAGQVLVELDEGFAVLAGGEDVVLLRLATLGPPRPEAEDRAEQYERREPDVAVDEHHHAAHEERADDEGGHAELLTLAAGLGRVGGRSGRHLVGQGGAGRAVPGRGAPDASTVGHADRAVVALGRGDPEETAADLHDPAVGHADGAADRVAVEERAVGAVEVGDRHPGVALDVDAGVAGRQGRVGEAQERARVGGRRLVAGPADDQGLPGPDRTTWPRVHAADDDEVGVGDEPIRVGAPPVGRCGRRGGGRGGRSDRRPRPPRRSPGGGRCGRRTASGPGRRRWRRGAAGGASPRRRGRRPAPDASRGPLAAVASHGTEPPPCCQWGSIPADTPAAGRRHRCIR